MDREVMEVRIKQWMPIFEEQARSGLSKKDWCNQNGVNRGLFFKWQRECRKYILKKQEESGLSVAGPAFVELSDAEALAISNNSNKVSVSAESEISLTISGINISLRGYIEEDNLTKVLRAISHVY